MNLFNFHCTVLATECLYEVNRTSVKYMHESLSGIFLMKIQIHPSYRVQVVIPGRIPSMRAHKTTRQEPAPPAINTSREQSRFNPR